MELLIITALVIGFLLISLLKKRVPPDSAEKNREWWQRMESDPRSRRLIDLDIERFENLCLAMIANLGLEIKEKERVGPKEVLVTARSRQPLFGGEHLILIYLESRGGGPVASGSVTELKQMVRAQGALKGIILTNTYSAGEDIPEPDGDPVEIIDGIELGCLLQDPD